MDDGLWVSGLGSEDDLAFGQGVLVAARWLLIAAGLALALIEPASPQVLRAQVVGVLLLAVLNFGLHAQVLRGRPTLRVVAYAASAADLLVITGLVILSGGYQAAPFVFYFPVLLAVSMAFPRVIAGAYTAAALVLYGTAGIVTMPAGGMRDLVLRLAMMAAVAVCGGIFAWVEERRRAGLLGGSQSAATDAQDLFFGQIAVVWARWAVIGGLALTFFWSADDAAQTTWHVLLLVGLLVVNFYLHGRYLMDRPANRALILLATIVDLALVMGATLLFGHGYPSQLFLLAYPALFAFALVAPPRLSIPITAAAIAAYLGVIAVADLNLFGDAASLKAVLERAVTLAAMGGLGTYYWRLQRRRRSVASGELAR